jgi:polar amino acid transport system substrate-binding protein
LTPIGQVDSLSVDWIQYPNVRTERTGAVLQLNRLGVVWSVILVATLVILGGFSTVAQDASVPPPDDLVTAGRLTYGVAASFPPYEYQQDGEYAGFDIEMGAALAEIMGLEAEISDMQFDGLIPALQGNRIDLINSAMYINPDREEQVDFIPYMIIGETIVVPQGNPKNVGSLDDLSGLTVAVTVGAIEEIFATDHNEVLLAAGKPEMTILTLPTANDAILATQQGRADAYLHSTPGAAYLMQEMPDTFEVAAIFALDTRIGMAVRKGDTAMKASLEAALAEMVESGQYDELMAKYNLPQELSLFQEGATPVATPSS